MSSTSYQMRAVASAVCHCVQCVSSSYPICVTSCPVCVTVCSLCVRDILVQTTCPMYATTHLVHVPDIPDNPRSNVCSLESPFGSASLHSRSSVGSSCLRVFFVDTIVQIRCFIERLVCSVCPVSLSDASVLRVLCSYCEPLYFPPISVFVSF